MKRLLGDLFWSTIRDRELFEAVIWRRDEEVKSWLSYGASPNYEVDGSSLLHIAARDGFGNIAKSLISEGADVNAYDYKGNGPLHCASANGHHVIIDLLLSSGAHVRARNNQDKTPLHLAAEHGHNIAARNLLRGGTDLSERDHMGRTPLHISAERNHSLVIEVLLSKGADITDLTNDVKCALHIAAEKGHMKAVLAMLEDSHVQENLDIKDKQLLTPRECAVMAGETEIANAISVCEEQQRSRRTGSMHSTVYSKKVGHLNCAKLTEADVGKDVSDLNRKRLCTVKKVQRDTISILKDALKKKGRLLVNDSKGKSPLAKRKHLMSHYAPVTEDLVECLIEEVEKLNFRDDSSSDSYAYVIPDDHTKTVYLGRSFWRAPNNLGYDSKPGILIHEASHFLWYEDFDYSLLSTEGEDEEKQREVNTYTHDWTAGEWLCQMIQPNANTLEYEFELCINHGELYENGRYQCCGESEQASVCKEAVPHEYTKEQNITEATGSSSIEDTNDKDKKEETFVSFRPPKMHQIMAKLTQRQIYNENTSPWESMINADTTFPLFAVVDGKFIQCLTDEYMDVLTGEEVVKNLIKDWKDIWHIYRQTSHTGSILCTDEVDRSLVSQTPDIDFRVEVMLFNETFPDGRNVYKSNTWYRYLSLDTDTFQDVDNKSPAKLFFIVHGYKGSIKQCPWMMEMKRAIFSLGGNVHVVLIDWEEGAKMRLETPLKSYEQAAKNTELVGERVAEVIEKFCNDYSCRPENIHLIGFGLGAQCCGWAGKKFHESWFFKRHAELIGRISGLDPESRHFEECTGKSQLQKTDAQFVDIIHADMDGVFLNSGMKDAIGHLDFYLRGGFSLRKHQSRIHKREKKFGNLHHLAYKLYIDSIIHPEKYTVRLQLKNSVCIYHNQVVQEIGYHSNRYELKRGVFIFTVSEGLETDPMFLLQ